MVTPPLEWPEAVLLLGSGFEHEGGRGNTCFPVEEGSEASVGKPWAYEAVSVPPPSTRMEKSMPHGTFRAVRR